MVDQGHGNHETREGDSHNGMRGRELEGVHRRCGMLGQKSWLVVHWTMYLV